MPTYEYACKACGHEFEQFQSMTAKPLRKCPECGKLRLERLIGAVAGLIFKGGGFYETDYRSESYRKAAKEESKAKEPAAEAKGADKPPAAGESKPASPTGAPKPGKAGPAKQSGKAD